MYSATSCATTVSVAGTIVGDTRKEFFRASRPVIVAGFPASLLRS